MPAVLSSTVTSRSFVQVTKSVLSQTNIPRDPVRVLAAQEVYVPLVTLSTNVACTKAGLGRTVAMSKSVPRI